MFKFGSLITNCQNDYDCYQVYTLTFIYTTSFLYFIYAAIRINRDENQNLDKYDKIVITLSWMQVLLLIIGSIFYSNPLIYYTLRYFDILQKIYIGSILNIAKHYKVTQNTLNNVDIQVSFLNLVASILWVYSLADRYINKSYNECSEKIVLFFSFFAFLQGIAIVYQGSQALGTWQHNLKNDLSRLEDKKVKVVIYLEAQRQKIQMIALVVACFLSSDVQIIYDYVKHLSESCDSFLHSDSLKVSLIIGGTKALYYLLAPWGCVFAFYWQNRKNMNVKSFKKGYKVL